MLLLVMQTNTTPLDGVSGMCWGGLEYMWVEGLNRAVNGEEVWLPPHGWCKHCRVSVYEHLKSGAPKEVQGVELHMAAS